VSTMSVRLPGWLHKRLREFAAREGTSINQLINSAVAEKLAALATEEYLETRAKRASRQSFEAALRTIPAAEPADFDRLPQRPKRRGRRTVSGR
jgi:hypothetical protein